MDTDQNDRMLVCVCGHGPPNYTQKNNWCVNNLSRIEETCPEKYRDKIDYRVFCYDVNVDTDIFIEKFNADVIKQPGVIGEFIYKNLAPDNINNYNRIILMLDDIELRDNFNLAKMVEIQDADNFDIVSPCLTSDSRFSHSFMKYVPEFNLLTRETNFMEFFFYMFRDIDTCYRSWYNLFNVNTKWMWGLDYLIYTHLKMKLGILNSMSMKHWFLNQKSNGNPHAELSRVCSEYKLNIRTYEQLTLKLT